MPDFDLATAKPVTKGFDINTAKPVSENSGQAYRQTVSQFQNQGYAGLDQGDPRRVDYEATLKDSSKRTNDIIASGEWSKVYKDLPLESVNNITRKLRQRNERTGVTRANLIDPFIPPANDSEVKKLIELEKLRLQSPEKAQLSESIGEGRGITPGFLEGPAIGFQSGLRTIARGVGLTGENTESNREAERLAAQYGPSSVKAGKLAGEAAPFLVPGLAATNITSLPIRASVMASIGGAEGGTIAKGEGGDASQVVLGTLVGAALGGGLEVAVPYLNRVARRVTGGSGQAFAPDGTIIPEFVDDLARQGNTLDDFSRQVVQDVDPDQAIRQQFLQQQGLQPTRAQITRDAADFQAQQEAVKTSGRVRNALEAQEAHLTSRFDDAVRRTGGNPATPTSPVVDNVVNKATRLDNEISGLYADARERASGDQVVRFQSLIKTLQNMAPDNDATQGAVRSILGKLRARGAAQGFKPSGRVTVEVAEEIRKQINELYDPKNGYRNIKLREMKEALDDDVFRASGNDIFKKARKAKADFESELTRAKISKFDQRRANLVRDVLENKIGPDELVDKVVYSKRWRAEDLQQLKDYVEDPAAFNDMRAEVLQSIKDRAFIGPQDANGLQALSRDKLEKALNSIGQKKLEVLFTAEERSFLNNMMRVARLREPVRGTALGKGPTGQAIAELEKKLRELPIMGALVNVINVDAAGRAALRGSPQRLPIPYKESIVTPAISASGVAAASQPDDEN